MARKSIDLGKVDDIIGGLGITATSPGCSLAIVEKGTTIYEHGYGMADLDHHIENTPATVFHAASLAKQFTAMAIMLLVKDNRLSLNYNVHDYVPQLAKLKPQVPNITIAQILQAQIRTRFIWPSSSARG